MTPKAVAVSIQIKDLIIQAYQVEIEEKEEIFLTHRLMAEPIGLNKGTAQRFCKANESELPPTVTALVPDKPRPVALSPWTAAVAFWTHYAEKGNETAKILASAQDRFFILNVAEVEESNPPYPKDIEDALASLPSSETLPTSPEVQQLEAGLNLIVKWLEEAGLDKEAIAQWKLNVLAQKFPPLEGIVNDASQFLATSIESQPTGMIASQLAERVREQLGRKVTSAQVNTALHELGLQDWAKTGSRERKLTEKGQKYGRATLVTSKTNQWSGAQIRWFDHVVPVLCEYFNSIS